MSPLANATRHSVWCDQERVPAVSPATPITASGSASMVALQRTVGNQAVSRWMREADSSTTNVALGNELVPVTRTTTAELARCAAGAVAGSDGECLECASRRLRETPEDNRTASALASAAGQRKSAAQESPDLARSPARWSHYEPSQAARVPRLQSEVRDRAVAREMAQHRILQRGVEQAESEPTETGAETTGLGAITCSVLPDFAVVALVRAYFASLYPHASNTLVHYLSGGGKDFPVNVTELLTANPRAKDRIAQHIGSGHKVGDTGQWIDRTSGGAPIRQADYDSKDWSLALGGVDEVHWEILDGPAADGSMSVRISIVDPYEWHPDEERGTQCLHETMERQKSKGAANYNAVGSGDVQLTFGPLSAPEAASSPL